MARYGDDTPEIRLKTVEDRLEGKPWSEEDPRTSNKDLPWASWIYQQCKAVREPREGSSGYWGRCELKRNHDGIDHALERGMDTPRWSTDWTG